MTPLHRAALAWNGTAIVELLCAGAGHPRTDEWGNTPLELVFMSNRTSSRPKVWHEPTPIFEALLQAERKRLPADPKQRLSQCGSDMRPKVVARGTPFQSARQHARVGRQPSFAVELSNGALRPPYALLWSPLLQEFGRKWIDCAVKPRRPRSRMVGDQSCIFTP